MAHELMENDTMFSVKEKPWHGLGTVVSEAPNTEEAIKLSGLDWGVELEPLKGTVTEKYSDHYAVLRMDNLEHLGVVGPNYTPLQNIKAFEFFDGFVEGGFCEFETAGSLLNGRKIFILAKIKIDDFDIQKNDPVQSYILLSNSHDGSTAVRMGYTPIRVVCANTLKMAHENNRSQLIRIRHTLQVEKNLEEIAQAMDIINQQFIVTAEKYKWLATRDINPNDLKKYVKQVFSVKSLEKQLEEEQKEEKHERILEYVTNQLETEPEKNWWTAYNSVQHYLQHGSERSTLENNYNNLWFGQKDQKNRKALESALSLAG
jgi:phage/plasmid-like protein (TIGR03299 family)